MSGITKRDRLLLQSASSITKCDSYYKVRRNKEQRRTQVTNFRNSNFENKMKRM